MEAAAKIVVDASVAIKWFSVEDHSDTALRLKQAYEDGEVELLAPELLLYELGNALRYNPGFGSNEVKRALRDIEDLQIGLYPLRGELSENAVEIAFRYGLTLYDAAYISVASTRKATYYTADDEVVRKASLPFVMHLRDLEIKD